MEALRLNALVVDEGPIGGAQVQQVGAHLLPHHAIHPLHLHQPAHRGCGQVSGDDSIYSALSYSALPGALKMERKLAKLVLCPVSACNKRGLE